MQALTTLNEEIFVDCARALGRRMVAEGGRTTRDVFVGRFDGGRTRSRCFRSERIDRAVVASAARIAAGGVDRGRGYRSGGPSVGFPGKSSITALAVSAVIARVLLDLDETITKE